MREPGSESECLLVPGGGLMAHEVLGGHTLAQHVGRTEEFLRIRLATDPDLDIASTFFDRQTAERALGQLLDDHDHDILLWIASGTHRLALTRKASYPVGRAIMRGIAAPVPVSGMKVVLRRSAVMPTGYRIHTAMVEL